LLLCCSVVICRDLIVLNSENQENQKKRRCSIGRRGDPTRQISGRTHAQQGPLFYSKVPGRRVIGVSPPSAPWHPRFFYQYSFGIYSERYSFVHKNKKTKKRRC
ncbi:unnamed protein product, partial [Laminaria digitata]